MGWLKDALGGAAGGALAGGGWGAVIGGAAGLIGGSLTNEANRREARRNRQFQAGMSNTSYQRAVADMRAAGLNPMLAYGQGGASTPSGAQATFENAAEGVIDNAKTSMMMKAELEKIKSDTDLDRESILTQRALQDVHRANAKNIREQTKERDFWNIVKDIFRPPIKAGKEASEKTESVRKKMSPEQKAKLKKIFNAEPAKMYHD